MTQSSRGMEKPTAFPPFAKMWIRISVLVSLPPQPAAISAALHACRAFSTSSGRMLPFQSVRLSSPMSRMFCAPMDGPLTMACDPPMSLTSLITK